MNLTPAQWAAVIMLGANLFVFGLALIQAVREYELRSGQEGARPWRKRGPLRIVSAAWSAVWRGLLVLVTALAIVCTLAAAMGVGAWVVLFWL